MRDKRINEIKGIFLIAVSLMVFASLLKPEGLDLSLYTSHANYPPVNPLGIFGAYLGGILVLLFGRWPAFIVPVLLFLLGVKVFLQQAQDLRPARVLGGVGFLISVSSLIGVALLKNQTEAFYQAGFLGFSLSRLVASYLDVLGGYIIFITLALAFFALVSEMLISTLLLKVKNNLQPAFQPLILALNRKKERPAAIKNNLFARPEKKEALLKLKAEPSAEEEKGDASQAFLFSKPKIQIKAKPPEDFAAEIKPKEVKIGDYRLPTIELLNSPPPIEARQIKDDLEANARILEETLGDFGIEVKVTDIERGPVITRYELEPAPGVKITRIVTLSDDIALTMKAQSVRIVAPIPGKARVGVEVPNSHSSLVYIKELLFSQEYVNSESKLTLALGKDIAGHPVIDDLSDMPHLLIAGTTGSGKTVCVNSLIVSMLLRSTPQELKFLMIDPKMVELAPFNGLPHLLCPVVTDAKKAAVALNWVVHEMEERYQLLAKVSARNIDAYNEKQEKIPYIVVIIDELADLMIVSRDQIENAITRLAQLSRAVGIHLILATQRPSVDVVTGVIKANFPARISFKVASKVDSRTVLDINGADKLLGKGDMLFMRPGEEKVTRAQGALVSDKEIERLIDFIKAQAEPVYDEEILKEQSKSGLPGAGEKDEMFDEAVRVVMESNQASVSILQRRLRLGYSRAARIIDMMEQDGLVGPFEGSKPRKILVDRQEWLKKYTAGQEVGQ